MMLASKLCAETSKRIPGGYDKAILDDAWSQAAYNMDAPNWIVDGVIFWEDPEFPEVRGVVHRMVRVRSDG